MYQNTITSKNISQESNQYEFQCSFHLLEAVHLTDGLRTLVRVGMGRGEVFRGRVYGERAWKRLEVRCERRGWVVLWPAVPSKWPVS